MSASPPEPGRTCLRCDSEDVQLSRPAPDGTATACCCRCLARWQVVAPAQAGDAGPAPSLDSPALASSIAAAS